VVPGYEMVRELGRGGMGVVYLAKQTKLNRPVALKMILEGGHAGAEELARFKTEAEAIARLQHPNIVQIFEVGEHEGRPFFSLEYCAGGSLDRKLAGTPLPPKQAAQLAGVLARAVQAAHDRNVIHRDLKPANVLLSADGTPKITDFGLARKLDEAGRTATNAVMGTPSYMAPEQAVGKSKEIGPAADVYALGAILYELLTGRPPFKAAAALDTLMQVVADEPVPPSRLQSKVPRDLETICLKCLNKEPSKRYAGAAALAADLGRFQADEPIQARPTGAVERTLKWARRRRALAALVVVSVLAAGGLVSGGAFFTARLAEQKWTAEQLAVKEADARKRADREKQAAQEERDKARSSQHAIQISQAVRSWELHDVADAERVLSEVAGPFRQTWEQRYVLGLCRRKALPLPGPVLSAAISADGKRIVWGSERTVKVWDGRTGQRLRILAGHTGEVLSVAVSADGKRIVSGSADRALKVWDGDTGQVKFTLEGHGDRVTSVAVSADGKRIVSGSLDRTVKVWDAQTGKDELTLKGHTAGVTSVALSADGKRIVSGGRGIGDIKEPGEVKVWDAETGQHLLTLKGHSRAISGVCFSPDRKRIVSGSEDRTLKVWDVETGQVKVTLTGHTREVRSVCFSPDGCRIVSGSHDNTVKVWEAPPTDERP
jgi:hypothetical protein